MMLLQSDSVAPPAWLPLWLENTWVLLDVYPGLLSLSVLAVGLLLAVLVRGFILFWGLKLTARTTTDLDEKLVRLGAGVAALLVGYLSMVAAVEALPLVPRATQIITRILVSILILQLLRAGLKASSLGLQFLSRIRDRFSIIEERTIPLFDLTLTLVVVAISAYAILQVWNIDPAAWLASAGIVGLAVGFAAKDSLANLFAGFFIIADVPYKVGDYVLLDTGERGEITRVGMRSTRMLTRDDVEVIIPNSVMAMSKIVNESGGPWVKSRIRVKVGVAYGSDVDKVVEVLERVAVMHGTVAPDPAPRVRMRGFGDSSLDFELLCWVPHPSQRGLVSHELYMDIYKTLVREGFEIPFPQQDVWVRRMPDVVTGGAEGE